MRLQTTILALIITVFATAGCNQQIELPPVKQHIVQTDTSTSESILISHEKSGKLYEQVKREIATKRITEREVYYRANNRHGCFTFRIDGTLQRFTNYELVDARKVKTYQAEYDVRGKTINNSTWYDNTGSVIQSFKRLPDKTSETLYFENNILISRKTVHADGSLTNEFFDHYGLVNNKIELPAGPQAVIARALHSNSSSNLELNQIGENISSWKYNSGKYSHSGKIAEDGNIVFTLSGDKSETFHQVWRPIGEDWSRTYYMLHQVERFHGCSDKVLWQRFTLYPNSLTPKTLEIFRKDGTLIYCHSYDKQGRHICSLRFDQEGNIVNRISKFPLIGKPKPVKIEANYVQAPQDKENGFSYRLNGEPFAELPAPPGLLNPLFVADSFDIGQIVAQASNN